MITRVPWSATETCPHCGYTHEPHEGVSEMHGYTMIATCIECGKAYTAQKPLTPEQEEMFARWVDGDWDAIGLCAKDPNWWDVVEAKRHEVYERLGIRHKLYERLGIGGEG
jgi:rRNA maturation protein Nop10